MNKPKSLPGIRKVSIFLILLLSISSTIAQEITVETPPTVHINETFTVNVTIQGNNITGVEFKLLFNNSILNATKVEEGPFLKNYGSTLTIPSNLSNSINNTKGEIRLGSALVGSAVASGDGTVATITFKAILIGNTLLDLRDVTLVDENITPVSNVNIRDSNVVAMSDTTPPNIALNLPVNGSILATSEVTFVYTPMDESSILNCSLYIDGELNQTDCSIENGMQNNFTSNLGEGFHEWNVECTDTWDNSGFAVSNYTLIIDKTPPVITIEGVADGESYNENRTLTYTVTDNLDPEPEVISNYPNGTVFSENGAYTVNITAIDDVGNSANKSISFTIKKTIECYSDEDCNAAQFCNSTNKCQLAFEVSWARTLQKRYRQHRLAVLFISIKKVDSIPVHNTTALIHLPDSSLKEYSPRICFPPPRFNGFTCLYLFRVHQLGDYYVDAKVNGVIIGENVTSFYVKD